MTVPGHTPGSSFIFNKELEVCFTGDTLLEDGIGSTFYPGGDE